MIRISQPCLKEISGKIYMSSIIEDECQKIKEEIYYSTTKEYGRYFSTDVADAFVVGMLLPAARYNEDIIVDGAISDRLFYNINNSILYMLSLVWGHRVRLIAKDIVSPQYNATGVGCGCSLGVDSLAAILSHMNNQPVKSYQITHLTYFNVGAMGYANLQKAKESFDKDCQMVLSYAKKINKPVVCVESNFSLLYREFDFDQSGDLRNFSAALSLQKLFGKYLYGSSYPIKDFKFEQSQTGYYETLLAPLLSTSNMELVIANPDMSRIDKTKYLVDKEDAYQNLYVCWKELIVNKNPNHMIAQIKDQYLNCTRCDKCLRTLLALDVFGNISSFSNLFDIDYYNKIKASYIAKVIYRRKGNAFYEDLYALMLENNFQIPLKAKVLLMMHYTKLMPIYGRIARMIKLKS